MGQAWTYRMTVPAKQYREQEELVAEWWKILEVQTQESLVREGHTAKGELKRVEPIPFRMYGEGENMWSSTVELEQAQWVMLICEIPI